jgi:hypothetical protein
MMLRRVADATISELRQQLELERMVGDSLHQQRMAEGGELEEDAAVLAESRAFSQGDSGEDSEGEPDLAASR